MRFLVATVMGFLLQAAWCGFESAAGDSSRAAAPFAA